MLIKNRRGRENSEMWTFVYREMLIKTVGGGKFWKLKHFPIGKCK